MRHLIAVVLRNVSNKMFVSGNATDQISKRLLHLKKTHMGSICWGKTLFTKVYIVFFLQIVMRIH
jgi:hypothetical protein